jgi:hypothetical protein
MEQIASSEEKNQIIKIFQNSYGTQEFISMYMSAPSPVCTFSSISRPSRPNPYTLSL